MLRANHHAGGLKGLIGVEVQRAINALAAQQGSQGLRDSDTDGIRKMDQALFTHGEYDMDGYFFSEHTFQ